MSLTDLPRHNAEKAIFEADQARVVQRVNDLIDVLKRSHRVYSDDGTQHYSGGALYYRSILIQRDDQALDYLKRKLQALYENMRGEYPLALNRINLFIKETIRVSDRYSWYDDAPDGDYLEIESGRDLDDSILLTVDIVFNGPIYYMHEDAPEDTQNTQESLSPIASVLDGIRTELTQRESDAGEDAQDPESRALEIAHIIKRNPTAETEAAQAQYQERGNHYVIAHLKSSTLYYTQYNSSDEYQVDSKMLIESLRDDLQSNTSIGMFILVGRGAPHYMNKVRSIVESLNVRYIKAPDLMRARKIMRNEER